MIRNQPDSYVDLVKALCRPGGETEWVEYKLNNADPALANAADVE